MSGHDIHRKNEQKYWDYRTAARLALMPALQLQYGGDINISDINEEALNQASSWTALPGNIPNPKWNWKALVNKARRQHKRIELAIWMHKELCGLMLGKVSDRKVVVSIHYLQRNPENSLLTGEITNIAILFLDALSTILGCNEKVMMNPDQNLIEYYKTFGFDIEIKKGSKVTRLVRKI